MYIPSNLIGPSRPLAHGQPPLTSASASLFLEDFLKLITGGSRRRPWRGHIHDLFFGPWSCSLPRLFCTGLLFFSHHRTTSFFMGCSIIAQFLLSCLICCKHTDTSSFIDHSTVASSSFPLLTSAFFPGYLRWHVCIFTLCSHRKAWTTREPIHQ